MRAWLPSSGCWSCDRECLRSRCVVTTIQLFASIHVHGRGVRAAHCGPAMQPDALPVATTHALACKRRDFDHLGLSAYRLRRLHTTEVERPHRVSRRATPRPCRPWPAVLGGAWPAGAEVPAIECRPHNMKSAEQRGTLGQPVPSRAAGSTSGLGCLRCASKQRALKVCGQAPGWKARWSCWRVWTCEVGRPREHPSHGWTRGQQTRPWHGPVALRWCYAGSRPTTASTGRPPAALRLLLGAGHAERWAAQQAHW